MNTSTKHWQVPALWRWLTIAAILSFIPSLFFPYVGEEGVYTISTLEMWHARVWANPMLYGLDYNRPPFMNWVMLPFGMLFGPGHILVASRLITALSTLGTAGVLYGLTRQFGGSRRLAWIALLVYLSSDALLYHGWIAYSDPLFALLISGAVACLLVAAKMQRTKLLVASVVLITLAFLTKALTAYVFLGSAWLIIFWRHKDARRCLLSLGALCCYALLIAAPIIWFGLNSKAGFVGQGSAMVGDIINRIVGGSLGAWFWQLVSFPLETFCRFLPVSAIALYAFFRCSNAAMPDAETSSLDKWAGTIALFVLLNFLPYWFSTHGSIRYVLPLYPFIALLIAFAIERGFARVGKVTLILIAVVIGLKLIASAFFPMLHVRQRGDSAAVAKSFIAITGRSDRIFTDDTSSAGLCVIGNIDSLRWSSAPVTWPPLGTPDGWIISRSSSRPGTSVVREEKLGRERIFLLCSGKTCDSSGTQLNRVDATKASTGGQTHSNLIGAG